jgi:eukaryotic-like serine/threonine-protein kinase
MSLSAVDLLARLEQSGLLEQDRFVEVQACCPADAFVDADSLARELVRRKYLTDFQAATLLNDPQKPLVLGNYVLTGELGHGGMGHVYCAWHRRLKRHVALKTLSDLHIRTADELMRFRREAEAAGRLEHPHIVATYDAGEAQGTHFLVMQYISGMTLDHLVRQCGPMRIADAVALIIQAAQGLAYAHQRQVVHGDIKPANLILGADGVLRILDMGLARTDAADSGDSNDPAAVPMGSIDFLAPEQGEVNATPDPRSDLYSLGCTLYYLLTAHAVYDSGTTLERRLAHRDQPAPSLRQTRDDVPEDLDRIFKRLVAKDPNDRYETAADVIDALGSCITELHGSPANLTQLVDKCEPIEAGADWPTGKSGSGSDRQRPDPEDTTRTLTKLPYHVSTTKQRYRVALLAALGFAAAMAILLAAAYLFATKNRDGASWQDDLSQRRAAYWVLEAGGTIQVSHADVWLAVSQRTELPPGPLEILSVQLGGNTRVNDQDLANLQDAEDLQMLWLGGAPITDAGLVHLSELGELRHLGLNQTSITDAGLPFLVRLQKLQTLTLAGTRISDAGLLTLHPLQNLTSLNLRGTDVSDAGIESLHQLPRLTEVDLRDTRVSEQGVARVRAAHPGIIVRH